MVEKINEILFDVSIPFVFVALLVFWGFMIGHTLGGTYQRELQERVKCEVEFAHTPYKDIEGRCIEYFTTESN